MPFKPGPFFLIIVFSLCFIVLIPGCKKETAKTPWPSQVFEGNYTGTEVCSASGTQLNTISITATSATQISISNLYGSGKSFTGVVSNDSCIIQPQIYNNGAGNAQMQGNFVLISDTINLSILVATFGQQDICKAVLVKH